MDKDYFIQLTCDVYRLTLFFPKKEPLRYKLRDLSNEVLKELCFAGFSFDNLFKEEEPEPPFVLENLKVIDSFFEVAKTQNWVNSSDILNLQREYNRLDRELEKLIKDSERNERSVSESPVSENPVSQNFEEIPSGETFEKVEKTSKKNSALVRQERILEALEEKEKAQVCEVKKDFPEVTKRTLRRDFEFLVKNGLVKRIGERNNTFYCLNRYNPDFSRVGH